MMRRILYGALAVVLGIAALSQAGCAGRSKPASFYVLSPLSGSDLARESLGGLDRDVNIGVARVILPKYLRKPQIVTRTGENELQLAEYDRWAGKIEEDIGRVIARNLAQLLATDRVLSHPAMEAIVPDYIIKIDISRFDGSLGGDVELIASWSVFDNRETMVYGVQTAHISEPTGGRGYAAMVAAQSRALAELSRKLATVIKELTAG